MAIFVLFILGIANFAMHKAVLESGHPMMGQVPWVYHMLSGRISLVVEFVMLAGSMLMVAAGSMGWAWGYGFYSAVNVVAAWLIVTHRV